MTPSLRTPVSTLELQIIKEADMERVLDTI